MERRVAAADHLAAAATHFAAGTRHLARAAGAPRRAAASEDGDGECDSEMGLPSDAASSPASLPATGTDVGGSDAGGADEVT